jgi:hypothetical protein
MAYTNKKSAKRKHRKYRRRTKKGGVVKLVDHTKSNKNRPPSKREVNDAEAIQGIATDYTRAALDDALSIFSRQEQAQAQAQAPSIGVTVHGKSRAKREGPTPGQIKKAEQKALAKQLKEEEKAEKKAKQEQEKADKKVKQEEEKVAKEVTKAALNQAFSSMFGKGTGPKLRKRN